MSTAKYWNGLLNIFKRLTVVTAVMAGRRLRRKRNTWRYDCLVRDGGGWLSGVYSTQRGIAFYSQRNGGGEERRALLGEAVRQVFTRLSVSRSHSAASINRTEVYI